MHIGAGRILYRDAMPRYNGLAVGSTGTACTDVHDFVSSTGKHRAVTISRLCSCTANGLLDRRGVACDDGLSMHTIVQEFRRESHSLVPRPHAAHWSSGLSRSLPFPPDQRYVP